MSGWVGAQSPALGSPRTASVSPTTLPARAVRERGQQVAQTHLTCAALCSPQLGRSPGPPPGPGLEGTLPLAPAGSEVRAPGSGLRGPGAVMGLGREAAGGRARLPEMRPLLAVLGLAGPSGHSAPCLPGQTGAELHRYLGLAADGCESDRIWACAGAGPVPEGVLSSGAGLKLGWTRTL